MENYRITDVSGNQVVDGGCDEREARRQAQSLADRWHGSSYLYAPESSDSEEFTPRLSTSSEAGAQFAAIRCAANPDSVTESDLVDAAPAIRAWIIDAEERQVLTAEQIATACCLDAGHPAITPDVIRECNEFLPR